MRSFSVGHRIVTMTIAKPKAGAVVGIAMEWSPNRPRRLNPDEWAQYRAGRDAAIGELATMSGLRTLVVET